MRITPFHGYPDYIGRRMAFAGSVTGPAAYGTTGDKLDPFRQTMRYDAVFGGVSVSQTYELKFFPSAAAVRADWRGYYFFVGGGSVALVTPAGGGTGMTPGTYTVNATGGGGTGAQAVVTVTATSVTSATVTKPGTGYASAPTFSLAAAGGTPATLAATLSSAYFPVLPGANLSSESFIISGFCGQY